ncbi:integral membrane sensor signal transduction histidine kinase [Paenibacillus curdlanolyticus YK9]|uniref:histidine kinase n=1 Tax=Paenibacillus curdlanolyticus YK9 TaxID=717606 RepID=E0I877_9BACL|nr:sensor histidine kinase [Paenibacillus curdlanolyticus]EFM11382.1 integral membrane sensor signal transduction histidine kinase [Paenibacillus curdlanolyticus YK9]
MIRRKPIQMLSSFRNRMILIFFVIIILPFLLFAYYAHIKSIEGIMNANTTIQTSYLLQARKNFEIYLNDVNDQINVLIGNKRIQELLEREPKNPAEEESFTVNMLTVLYQTTPLVDAFRVRLFPIDPRTYPTYMSTIGESETVVGEEWFQRSKASISPTWHLSEPARGKSARPLLMYVKRFSGLYDQTPRGIIAADLSEDQIKRYFSPSDQVEDQKLLLLGEDGTVLYDSTANEWTGKPFPARSYIDAREDGSESLEIKGNTYLATSVGMDSEPWRIVSLTPMEQLTGTIDEITRLLVIILIVYLVCCVGVVAYITVNYTQPIVKLVRLMRRSESGDFRFSAPLATRLDEVGWLYRGYGSLIDRIEGLVEEASHSERKKKELEFQVLSHQINPHFLYNTLESIRWKAENHGRTDISEMVSALGNLLRLSLNSGKEITTLAREIEQVKAYVLIEQARMGKPVRILYIIDEETLAVPFLRLLLQPLVENAIEHSVRQNFEQGKIVLTGRTEGRDVVIELSDNGNGIPEEVLRRLEADEDTRSAAPGASRGGVGLRNVNDRLKLYFGSAYKLSIETGEGIGTRITLRHPILREGAQSTSDLLR